MDNWFIYRAKHIMFIAVLFIAIGLAILLNTFGLLTGSFWGIFWSAFFIAAGIGILSRKNGCPMCGWWRKGIHQKMGEHCCDKDDKEEIK